MIDEKLLKKIEEYCKINDIVDIETTINDFLLTGFNVAKYGTSPFDNSKKESVKPKKVEPIEVIQIQESKKTVVTTETPKQDLVKPKKSVRIIKSK